MSGTYRLDATTSNLPPTLTWELWVDGVLKGAFQSEPVAWDTTQVPDGAHKVYLAVYTQEGSVYPSNVIDATVNNSSAPPPPPGELTVSVDQLYTNKAEYKRGQPVYATSVLKASQEATLPLVTLAVRKRSTDRNHDFPARYDFPVSTTGATLESSRVFDRRGTYDYWAAYYQNGSWHNLTPKKSFTVRQKKW